MRLKRRKCVNNTTSAKDQKKEIQNMKNQAQIERQKAVPRQLSNMEAIVLCDIYDRLDKEPFCDAMSTYLGLAELLAENHAPEARAIKTMVEAEAQLNRIRGKARIL